jgi:hypothetical protein
MIAEEEALRAAAARTTAPAVISAGNSGGLATAVPATAEDDFDEEMWDELMNDGKHGLQGPPLTSATKSQTWPETSASAAMDVDDEDMWDMVHELETEGAVGKPTRNSDASGMGGTPSGKHPVTAAPLPDDDEDDLYMAP